MEHGERSRQPWSPDDPRTSSPDAHRRDVRLGTRDRVDRVRPGPGLGPRSWTRSPAQARRRPRAPSTPVANAPLASPSTSGCVPDTEPNDTPETAPVFDCAGLPRRARCRTATRTCSYGRSRTHWQPNRGTSRSTASRRPSPAPSSTSSRRRRARRRWSWATRSWRSAQGPDAIGPAVVSGVLLPAGRYLVGTSRSATANGQPPLDIGYQVDIAAAAPLPPVRRCGAQ